MEEKMREDDNAVCFGMGILLGVAAGALAAVLYAPKSGEETRKVLEDTASNLVQKYAPDVRDAKKQALTSIDVIRYKLERQYNRLSEAIRAKQIARAKEKESPVDYEIN